MLDVIPTLAVSLGDPTGIGPEVAFKALALSRDEPFTPLLVGALDVAQEARALVGDVNDTRALVAIRTAAEARPDRLNVLDLGPYGPVTYGEATAAGGRVAAAAIRQAVDLCLTGAADGLVTAPIHKAALALAGEPYAGHTELLAELCGGARHTMMLVSDKLRVGLVTTHVALRDAADGVTSGRIGEKLRVMDRALRDDFGIAEPRIAMMALNPHAGDDGVMGDEEARVLAPALRQAQTDGIRVEGPFPADGFFGTYRPGAWDAVLAMYHDQGLVPFKLMAFGGGVNVTAGLPIVRTSPDHGTAYAIAGRGEADHGSMLEAIRLALRMIGARRAARFS